jgi:transcriptional regulator with XRE-family HTH domain
MKKKKNQDLVIGKNIQTLRNKRGWSQTKLGKLLYIDQSVMSQIERGKRPLTLEQAQTVIASLIVG